LVKPDTGAMHMDRVRLVGHIGDDDCCVVHNPR
jgi:hypothetical protein